MGYICQVCDEGLPDDTPCPCTMAGDDTDNTRAAIQGSLTAEIARSDSAVRGFFNERFTIGLRDAQRRYREAAPPLAVPGAPGTGVNPGTVGTAADWLLRFLLHPQPDLHLAVLGAMQCTRVKINLIVPLTVIVESIGVSRSALAANLKALSGTHDLTFTGPLPGNTADSETLARCCWALALLTEACRGGPGVAARGPLGMFQSRGRVSGDDLLGLTPPAGLDQLARFRRVFETTLIPQLAARRGPWALGPTFTGSDLIRADADLIAAGLLLDLKTSAKKPSLAVTDILQVIGYALLDFTDTYRIDTVGIYSARYDYLATWPLGALLNELAGDTLSLHTTREEFQQLLLTQQGVKG